MKFPHCESNDCQFETGWIGKTLMYYPPRYDKNGNNLNPDRNKCTQDIRCVTCKKVWKKTWQNGLEEEATFELAKPIIMK